MTAIRTLLICSFLTCVIGAVSASAIAAEEITGITRSEGRGVPNGSSSDPNYLNWLVPTTDADYGYTKEKPIQIGGILEGSGHRWSSQYFASLLGPDGEPTSFERVKSCCGFPLQDEKFTGQGFSVGFLDVYDVIVGNSPPIQIYVSLYGEEIIYAPAGFTTRGDGP